MNRAPQSYREESQAAAKIRALRRQMQSQQTGSGMTREGGDDGERANILGVVHNGQGTAADGGPTFTPSIRVAGYGGTTGFGINPQSNYPAMVALFCENGAPPVSTAEQPTIPFELFEAVQERLALTKVAHEKSEADLAAKVIDNTKMKASMAISVDEIATLKLKVRSLQEQVDSSRKQNAMLVDQAANTDLKMFKLQDLNSDLHAKYEEKVKELNIKNYKTSDALVSMAQKDNVISALKRENADLERRLRRLEDDGDDHENSMGGYRLSSPAYGSHSTPEYDSEGVGLATPGGIGSQALALHRDALSSRANAEQSVSSPKANRLRSILKEMVDSNQSTLNKTRAEELEAINKVMLGDLEELSRAYDDARRKAEELARAHAEHSMELEDTLAYLNPMNGGGRSGRAASVSGPGFFRVGSRTRSRAGSTFDKKGPAKDGLFANLADTIRDTRTQLMGPDSFSEFSSSTKPVVANTLQGISGFSDAIEGLCGLLSTIEADATRVLSIGELRETLKKVDVQALNAIAMRITDSFKDIKTGLRSATVEEMEAKIEASKLQHAADRRSAALDETAGNSVNLLGVGMGKSRRSTDGSSPHRHPSMVSIVTPTISATSNKAARDSASVGRTQSPIYASDSNVAKHLGAVASTKTIGGLSVTQVYSVSNSPNVPQLLPPKGQGMGSSHSLIGDINDTGSVNSVAGGVSASPSLGKGTRAKGPTFSGMHASLEVFYLMTRRLLQYGAGLQTCLEVALKLLSREGKRISPDDLRSALPSLLPGPDDMVNGAFASMADAVVFASAGTPEGRRTTSVLHPILLDALTAATLKDSEGEGDTAATASPAHLAESDAAIVECLREYFAEWMMVNIQLDGAGKDKALNTSQPPSVGSTNGESTPPSGTKLASQIGLIMPDYFLAVEPTPYAAHFKEMVVEAAENLGMAVIADMKKKNSVASVMGSLGSSVNLLVGSAGATPRQQRRGSLGPTPSARVAAALKMTPAPVSSSAIGSNNLVYQHVHGGPDASYTTNTNPSYSATDVIDGDSTLNRTARNATGINANASVKRTATLSLAQLDMLALNSSGNTAANPQDLSSAMKMSYSVGLSKGTIVSKKAQDAAKSPGNTSLRGKLPPGSGGDTPNTSQLGRQLLQGPTPTEGSLRPTASRPSNVIKAPSITTPRSKIGTPLLSSRIANIDASPAGSPTKRNPPQTDTEDELTNAESPQGDVKAEELSAPEQGTPSRAYKRTPAAVSIVAKPEASRSKKDLHLGTDGSLDRTYSPSGNVSPRKAASFNNSSAWKGSGTVSNALDSAELINYTDPNNKLKVKDNDQRAATTYREKSLQKFLDRVGKRRPSNSGGDEHIVETDGTNGTGGSEDDEAGLKQVISNASLATGGGQHSDKDNSSFDSRPGTSPTNKKAKLKHGMIIFGDDPYYHQPRVGSITKSTYNHQHNRKDSGSDLANAISDDQRRSSKQATHQGLYLVASPINAQRFYNPSNGQHLKSETSEPDVISGKSSTAKRGAYYQSGKERQRIVKSPPATPLVTHETITNESPSSDMAKASYIIETLPQNRKSAVQPLPSTVALTNNSFGYEDQRGGTPSRNDSMGHVATLDVTSSSSPPVGWLPVISGSALNPTPQIHSAPIPSASESAAEARPARTNTPPHNPSLPNFAGLLPTIVARRISHSPASRSEPPTDIPGNVPTATKGATTSSVFQQNTKYYDTPPSTAPSQSADELQRQLFLKLQQLNGGESIPSKASINNTGGTPRTLVAPSASHEALLAGDTGLVITSNVAVNGRVSHSAGRRNRSPIQATTVPAVVPSSIRKSSPKRPTERERSLDAQPQKSISMSSKAPLAPTAPPTPVRNVTNRQEASGGGRHTPLALNATSDSASSPAPVAPESATSGLKAPHPPLRTKPSPSIPNPNESRSKGFVNVGAMMSTPSSKDGRPVVSPPPEVGANDTDGQKVSLSGSTNTVPKHIQELMDRKKIASGANSKSGTSHASTPRGLASNSLSACDPLMGVLGASAPSAGLSLGHGRVPEFALNFGGGNQAPANPPVAGPQSVRGGEAIQALVAKRKGK